MKSTTQNTMKAVAIDRFGEAEQLFKEALAAQRRALGEGHPSTARTYKLLLGQGFASNMV